MKHVYVCWTTWYDRYTQPENKPNSYSMNDGDDGVDVFCVFSDKNKAEEWKGKQNERAWKELLKRYDGHIEQGEHSIIGVEDMHFAHVREYELDKWVDPADVLQL